MTPTPEGRILPCKEMLITGYLTNVINSLRHLFTHKSSNLWLTAMCDKESFANGRFLAINIVVFDDEHGFLSIFWAKKSPIGISDRAGWV